MPRSPSMAVLAAVLAAFASAVPAASCLVLPAVALAQAELPTACGQWLPLPGPAGPGGVQGVTGEVRAMAVFDDGSGEALYIGGRFEQAGGQEAPYLARWDGVSLEPVPGADLDGAVRALYTWDDGTGEALYVGGDFTTAGGVAVDRVAKWDGTTWSALRGPTGMGANIGVRVFHAHADDAGEALFVGGYFTEIGGLPASRIARWDGAEWSVLAGPEGVGVDENVHTLATHDDGSGPALYVGGRFENAGGRPATYVARWDGSAWSPVATAGARRISPMTFLHGVFDLRSIGVAGRSALLAGGVFELEDAGDVGTGNFAAWADGQWSPIVGGFGLRYQIMHTLPFDDGSGERLHAIGLIDHLDREQAHNIIRLGEHGWEQLGGGLITRGNVLAEFRGELYAGGNFTSPGRFVARWSPAARCAADADRNCVLDAMDFLEFGVLFDRGDDRADFDGDGRLTVFDYLAFSNAFEAGCP